MKNIVLNIKSAQDLGYDTDSMEFISVGKYSNENGIISLIYDESVALGIDGVTTTLTVDSDNIVMLNRSGNAYNDFIVEVGRRHQCQYRTQYGDISIGVSGDSVENKLEETGELILKYSIDADARLISKNEMIIKISEDEN